MYLNSRTSPHFPHRAFLLKVFLLQISQKMTIASIGAAILIHGFKFIFLTAKPTEQSTKQHRASKRMMGKTVISLLSYHQLKICYILLHLLYSALLIVFLCFYIKQKHGSLPKVCWDRSVCSWFP